MYKKILAPSILSADFANLGRDIAETVNAGAEWIHFDVMDGHFVPSMSFAMPVLKCVRKVTDAFLDVHLMIENPEKYIPEFIRCGADSVTVHIETLENPKRALDLIRDGGCKTAISLNPETELEMIEDVLDQVDMVLVMTVHPGFGGQKYIAETEDKIRELAKIREERGLSFDIEVDGGINPSTVDRAANAGANVFVAGSAVFNGNIRENTENLMKKF